MKRSENETCLYCKFYKQTRVEHGQCRRNPPTGVGDKFTGKWPEVADSYWCGEFGSAHQKPQKMSATNVIQPRKHPAPVPQQPRTAQKPTPAPAGNSSNGPLKLEQ